MMYDFSSSRVRIIDLDMYREVPFRNEMGRAAAVFLSDGTLAREQFRGSSALYEVIVKASQPDRAQRYGTVHEFHAAWQAARNT
jgi:hypothetical protein